MKHLIKTSLWLLAFMVAGGMLVSCVEEEQEPDFSKAGGSTSAKIDVQMPAPGSQAFYAGSKVLLKGSGFSGSDEVYVQHATYQYDTDYEEYVADGPKVRAEVTNYTSTELTFVIPSEVLKNEYDNEAFVFIKRKGTEYKLGHMRLDAFPVYFATGQVLPGDEVTLESGNQSFAFTSDTKVYLQNVTYDNDGIKVGIGEKIQAEVISFYTSQLRFRVPSNIVGETLIILQYNGVECKLANNTLMIESPVSMGGGETFSGVPVTLYSNNNSFASTDKVYLQPVVATDNGGYADKGDRIQAVVTDISLDKINFTVPFEAIGMNAVIWVHDNMEFRLPNYLTVRVPIALNYDRLDVGSVAYLITISETFAFTSTDEIYLQSVTGKEKKVKADVINVNEWELDFLVPDLFNGVSGEAIVIFKRNGKEYELVQPVKIFA